MATDRGAAMTAPATGKLILNIGNSGGQFSGPESSLQIRSLADFITATSESRFSVPLVARTSVTDVTRQPATAIALQYSRSLLSLERQTRAVVRPGMRKIVRREIMERFDMSRPMHQIGNSRTNPLQTEHNRQMSTCSEHSRRRSKV